MSFIIITESGGDAGSGTRLVCVSHHYYPLTVIQQLCMKKNTELLLLDPFFIFFTTERTCSIKLSVCVKMSPDS